MSPVLLMAANGHWLTSRVVGCCAALSCAAAVRVQVGMQMCVCRVLEALSSVILTYVGIIINSIMSTHVHNLCTPVSIYVGSVPNTYIWM